ncbi:MAG: hypothetical protein V4582_15335 [Pseudomonadota bacterium]
MNRSFIAAALFAAAMPAMAGTNVNLSVTVGQPNFYGRIDIGDFPQPQLVYNEPVIIQSAPRYVGRPIYLRVPPGHMKHWEKHCSAYNACGQKVYFVHDDWYNNVYAPHYREKERGEHGRGHDHDRGEGDEHGHGKGKGHGHDKDHDRR